MRSVARAFAPLAVAFGALVAAGCGGAKLPPLDTAEAAKAAEAIELAPPEMRSKFAARALFEIETARFDASFLEGLDAMVNVAPEMRSRALAKAIDANMGLLDDACAAGGVKVMKRAAELAPDERLRMVWKDCEFAKHGLVSEADALKGEATALMLGHMMYVRVAAAGPVDPNELKLIKTLTKAAPPSDGGPPNDGEGDPPVGDDPLTAPLD